MVQAASSPFMRVAELADLLGVSASRGYRLIRQHRVPAVRRGRSVLIPRAAFHAWIAGQTDSALAALADATVASLTERETAK